MTDGQHTWDRALSGGWECTRCNATWPPEEGKYYPRQCIDLFKINADVRDKND